MTSDVKMVKYWGRDLQMFSEPFSKSSWGLSNVLFITLHPVTLISIDDSTFLLYRIFILGSHQEVFDSGASFKVHLYPIFAANLLNALTKPTIIRNHYAGLLIVVSVSSVVIVLVGGWLLCFDSDLVEGLIGVFTFSKCTVEMIFFLEKLQITAEGFVQ